MATMDSSRDPLTRLLNRRYLPVVLQKETEISIKHGQRYAVLFVDIDRFKQINDQYGHDTGDHVLRSLAERLAETVRAGDFAFRYGGEEFLLLLSDSNEGQAMQVAERLRFAVENNPVQLDDGRELAVTLSVGLALHEGHPDFWQVVRRADAALYRAKNEGRNRVVLADMSLVA